MSENVEPGYDQAKRALKREYNFGDTKSNQVIRSGILPTFFMGRNRYASLADVKALAKKFADPAIQKQYFEASYDRARRTCRAKAAAAELDTSKRAPSKANAS